MNTETCPFTCLAATAEELLVLQQRWNNGSLASRLECPLTFTHRHRDEILRRCGREDDEAALVRTVQDLIREGGSVHLASEVQDEIKEMNAEIWYGGERGDQDRDRIKQDWAQRHAPAWRRWRLLEYLFVAGRAGPRLTAAALCPAPSTRGPDALRSAGDAPAIR